MPLPPLYVQNLTLNARDRSRLNSYKLGLVEHLLKEAVRLLDDEEPPEAVGDRVRTALEVALWEPRVRKNGPLGPCSDH